MIAKLERTPCTKPQNKKPISNVRTECDQQQILKQQQHSYRLKTDNSLGQGECRLGV